MQHYMLMRGRGSHTQQGSVRHVRRFAAFLGRSSDTATPEDFRRFHSRIVTRYQTALTEAVDCAAVAEAKRNGRAAQC